jgi:translation elongation factor aEF-1 beta
MGEVAVTMRIMPAEADVFEAMKTEFVAKMKPYKCSEKEIGFGLKALYATFIVHDGEGGADKLEEMARTIKGVGEVDVQEMDRL